MKPVLVIVVPCLVVLSLISMLSGEDPDAISYPTPEFQQKHQEILAEIEQQKKREFSELTSAVSSYIQIRGQK